MGHRRIADLDDDDDDDDGSTHGRERNKTQQQQHQRRPPPAYVEDDDDDDENDNDNDEEDDDEDDGEVDDGDDGDGYYESGEEEEPDRHTSLKNSSNKNLDDVPLWQRVHQLNEEELEASSSVTSHVSGKLKRKRSGGDVSEGAQFGGKRPSSSSVAPSDEFVGRTNKNAPAVMKSNRPVRRLRIDADNTARKFRDPRFVEGSGTLDHDKFHQNYAFLDKYQEDEVAELGRAMKKVKNPEQRETLKEERC